MSDTFYSPYCPVSLSLCVYPTFERPNWPLLPHITSLSGFCAHLSAALQAGYQVPCLENKLISPHFTLSTQLPRRHCWCILFSSITYRRYLCSLVIFFLCAACNSCGQETKPMVVGVATGQDVNGHAYLQRHIPSHVCCPQTSWCLSQKSQPGYKYFMSC